MSSRATVPFAAALEAGKQLGAPDFGLAANADLICVKHAFPDEGMLAAGYAE